MHTDSVMAYNVFTIYTHAMPSFIRTDMQPAGKDCWYLGTTYSGFSGQWTEPSHHRYFLDGLEAEILRLCGDRMRFVGDDGVETTCLTDFLRRTPRALELPPREDGFAAVEPDAAAAVEPPLPPPPPLVRETLAEKAARRAAASELAKTNLGAHA
jgi:hypothetical protein